MPSRIFHLEMTTIAAFRRKKIPPGLSSARIEPPDPAFNARLYREVGADWDWTNRLKWSAEEWQAYADRDDLETWRAEWEDAESGFFELEKQDGGNVEIAIFGLLPAMIGKGLGGAMLDRAIARAWEIPGTTRVWVHTCTEDHEHALANYERRGFKVFKVEDA